MQRFFIALVTTTLLFSTGIAQSQVLKSEPAEGNLASGKRVLVDDGTCPAGQIKEVTGGSKTGHIARASRCIPHSRK
jgi:Family of unknown function (DUF6719)